MNFSNRTFNTSPASRLAIAVLSAQEEHPLAILGLELSSESDSDGWQQLLPHGKFKAVDGRPFDVPGGHWVINAEIADRLIAQLGAVKNPLVIDYEHQTLNSEKNGKPAIASGWFKEAEWREGSGLWIKPDWTPSAALHIKNDEYRFLSAVFPYDKATGEPLALHSAALVNRPGIDGLQAVTALNAQLTSQTQQETVMNETLRKLFAKLGIEIGDAEDMTDAQGTAALSALDALQLKADNSTDLETEIASLKAGGGAEGVDLSQYVPAVTYNALVTEMAALKAGSDQQTVGQLIADAQKEGRVLAAEVDYINSFAEQQGVAALKALLDKRPVLAALGAQQTEQSGKKSEQGKDADLTAEDLAVLKATGIEREAFIKSKQNLNA